MDSVAKETSGGDEETRRERRLVADEGGVPWTERSVAYARRRAGRYSPHVTRRRGPPGGEETSGATDTSSSGCRSVQGSAGEARRVRGGESELVRD